MNINSSYKTLLLYIIIVVFMLAACDTTSNIREPVKYKATFTVRAVIVPYKTRFGPEVANNIMAGSLEQAPEGSYYTKENLPESSSFGCLTSWANSNTGYKYLYRTNFLYFPKAFVASSKGRYKYVITKALSSQAPDGKLMGLTRCIVPYVKGIDKMLADFLKINGNENNPGIKLTMKTKSWEYEPKDN